MHNPIIEKKHLTRAAIEGIRRVVPLKTTSARQLRLLLFMAGVLFCYTVARAYLIPFVHDESYSFLNAVNSPLSDVLSLRFKDANNHPLNSWGMFVFSKLLGSSELSLRLPNLLAHLIYLFASLMIVRRFPSTIVAISSFLVISAFVILDVNYPQDRSAVFLIPLLGIAVIFAMNDVLNLQIRVARIMSLSIAVMVALILSVNFLPSVNFHSTTVWPYAADAKRMLADLEREKIEEHGSQTIRLGIDWWFAPTINFYRVTRDLTWLEPVTRKGLEGEYDYHYFHPGSFELIEARGVQIIQEYEIAGNRLGKSK